jgi:hypothetical protein
MADLQLRIMGEDNASAAFQGVSQAARAAGQILIDFYKDSLKAFMESDKAQRQLAVVAKDLTDAFKQQAQAIAETNNLSDELVMGVQTMLLRYGEAPAAVEATTQAVLDYAAATGADAQTATDALTRGVEAGTGHFKGLGISIEATGDKTKDLSLATAELAKKYGGAAAADAESLSGGIRGASEAFGELQESFGGFLATIAEKTGGLYAVTTALREMGEAADFATRFFQKGGLDELKKMGSAFFGGSFEDVAASKVSMSKLIEGVEVDALSEAAINRQKLNRAKTGGGASRVSGGGGGGGAGGGGGVMDFKNFEMDLRPVQEFDLNDVINSDSKARERRFEEEAKTQALSLKKHFDEMEKLSRESAKALAAHQKEFAKAGADIGAAFTNNITAALEQLASGGEQDAGKILASILAGVLSTVGSVVGNLLLPGVGGALGGAIGGLAGAGVKALANGPNVTINTMDSRSTREFFESDGGRGFYNAQRTGRSQGGGR